MKQFTSAATDKAPIRFELDGEVFEAAPVIGASVLQDMLAIANMGELVQIDATAVLNSGDKDKVMEIGKAVNAVSAQAMQFLDSVLLPESAARFAARMRSTTEPITLETAFEVWRWLLSEYGARPTQPSSSSSNGHDGTGQSLTVGAPPAASIPSNSPSTDT